MKNLALALVVGMMSVGAVSAQTNKETKVKTNKNEVKIKSETEGRKAGMKGHDGKHKEHKSPEERAKSRTEKMTSELNLTPDQASRIYELNMRKTQKMQEIKERHAGADRSAMGPEMKEAKQVWNNDLKAALTPDQYAKYQTLQAERRAKMKEKHKGMEGKKRGHHKSNK